MTFSGFLRVSYYDIISRYEMKCPSIVGERNVTSMHFLLVLVNFLTHPVRFLSIC